MATTLAFWFLLMIVQGDGAVGMGFGSEEACKEARLEVISKPELLKISDCTQISVTTPPVKPEKT